MRQFLRTALIIMGVSIPCTALTQEATEAIMPDGCKVTSESNWIRLVHCPEGLEDADYAMAGQAACGDKIACGAWIWTNASDMPLTAPDNHDGLNKEQVTSAVGVWDAENKRLIRITRD
jgi:hypothetical protein